MLQCGPERYRDYGQRLHGTCWHEESVMKGVRAGSRKIKGRKSTDVGPERGDSSSQSPKAVTDDPRITLHGIRGKAVIASCCRG